MHEHEPTPTSGPEPEQTPHAEDDLDPALLEAALDAMRRYAASERYRDTDDAFDAYLDLHPDRAYHEDAEAEFRERYLGHFLDRWSFIRNRLDEFGWSQAVATFKADQGMWPDDLNWDPDVLWEHFSELYDLVEHDGGIYAFRV